MSVKNKIRKINKLKRTSMSKAEIEEKSSCACKNFLKSEIYEESMHIMLYIPLGNELNTNCIIKKAFDDGKCVIVPVTDEKSGDITPCYLKRDTKLAKGAFSVTEPLEKDIADVMKIDTVIVPGIAFDKKGVRVGFGKGCYDKFLKRTSAIKVGLCYDFQICEDIIADEHDVAMDFLITDTGIIKL